jgi:hypothetical protein
MGRRTRVVAAVATAAATAVAVGLAVPSAGAASGTATGAAGVGWVAAKAGTPVKAGAPGKPAIDPLTTAAAKRFGLNAAKIQQALIDIKMSFAAKGTFPKGGLLDPAVVRVFARKLGIPVAKARAVLKFLDAGSGKTGKGNGKPAGDGKIPPQVVAYLSKALHISPARATALFAQVQKLSVANNGVTVKNPAFVKLAASVNLSPQRLMDVLVAMKKALADELGGKKPGQSKPGQPPAPKK